MPLTIILGSNKKSLIVGAPIDFLWPIAGETSGPCFDSLQVHKTKTTRKSYSANTACEEHTIVPNPETRGFWISFWRYSSKSDNVATS